MEAELSGVCDVTGFWGRRTGLCLHPGGRGERRPLPDAREKGGPQKFNKTGAQ